MRILDINNFVLRRAMKKRAIVWKLFIPKAKYALISDNHGYIDVYQETVNEIFEMHNDIKGVFHLGDIFGSSTNIDECIDCLKFSIENNILQIKGNHCRKVVDSDIKHKYSYNTQRFKKKLYNVLKMNSDIYSKFIQFPDKIETDYFDLAHANCHHPYYSSNGYNNEYCLLYDLISKPMFISHNHMFYMLSKNGMYIKKTDLEFDTDILIDNTCVVSIPSMNYSREKHKYHHGYMILSILENGSLLIRAHHLHKDFVKKRPVIDRKYNEINNITLKHVLLQ